jgi:predicted protein tyrosine phosphatase
VYQTTVIALSAADAERFRSSEPYVVIQFTDPSEQHPYIHPFPAMKARIGFHFDDVVPSETYGLDSFQRYIPMSSEQAQEVVKFINAWHGKVATIVIHCKMGLSRSVGVTVAVREHFGVPTDELFVEPKHPNPHCRALVAAAFTEYHN